MIRDFNRLVRYLAYTLELLVLFMLQETPGLMPAVLGVRPVLLFPAVLSIAMFEQEVPAMAFGIFGGLLCDFGLSDTLGFHALALGVLCFFISGLVRAYFQTSLATAVFTGVWGLALTVGAQWLCLYVVAHGQPVFALTHHYLPKYFYSLLFVPLMYFLNRGLSQALGARENGGL